MIVPEYWAEGRVQSRVAGRQVTVRRFGWSDVSTEEAQRLADERAHDALARLAAGEKLGRRERKVPYNGADGVPIREEIVSRHGDAIVTRNIYGALCLNTPDVLFGDIDFNKSPPWQLTLALFGVLASTSIAIGFALPSRVVGIGGPGVSIPVSFLLSRILFGLFVAVSGGVERRAMRRLHRFVDVRREWHLRVYRTPAGLRVLAMHRTFDPTESETLQCLKSMGTDPIYTRMCRNQHCFRARVTPKPWRIGMNARIRPRPGVWPLKEKWLPERTRWIEAYERSSSGYSACQFVESIGSGAIHSRASEIQRLHDELSRAQTHLPTA